MRPRHFFRAKSRHPLVEYGSQSRDRIWYLRFYGRTQSASDQFPVQEQPLLPNRDQSIRMLVRHACFREPIACSFGEPLRRIGIPNEPLHDVHQIRKIFTVTHAAQVPADKQHPLVAIPCVNHRALERGDLSPE